MSVEGIKVGLALGSGSLRGLAHIGVLQILTDENIPIDLIAGTSIGAVVGSIYSVGADMHFLEKVMCSLEERDFFDVTVPRQGLLRGERIQSLIRTLTRDIMLYDTIIPFAAVACDIEKGEPYIPTDCKLHEAVRASMSIPGVFKPYMLNDRLLVDGAVVDRVPVSVAKDMGADIVIAVDVGYRGSRGKISNIMEVIIRSLEILEWGGTRERIMTADVSIAPKTMHINPYSLSQAEECINNGRIAAREAIPAIRQAIEAAKLARETASGMR